jgi:hypothetical protein
LLLCDAVDDDEKFLTFFIRNATVLQFMPFHDYIVPWRSADAMNSGGT